MLYKPNFSFPYDPELYAAHPVPQPEEWKALWAAWDTVTRHMLPADEVMSKPIPLRNPCVFYLGHIPTFLDMHLARATDGSFVVPTSYVGIFARGVDPDVDAPENCHVHSEIPDSWPAAAEIHQAQLAVRDRVLALYELDDWQTNRKVAEALWLGFEHEAMHLETFLYIELQSERRLLPPNSVRPDFLAAAREADARALENEWFTVPAAQIAVGLDDSSAPDCYFGWDNEKPVRHILVHTFQAKARPITNGEYALYVEQTQRTKLPASWASQECLNGFVPAADDANARVPNLCPAAGGATASQEFLRGKVAKTVFGPIPLAHALHWPVAASYDELAGCARWMGGRLPTYEEVRSMYHYVSRKKAKEATNVLAKTISAVNG
jgi:formylglycine-generating enzyme required for sulfatase activity